MNGRSAAASAAPPVIKKRSPAARSLALLLTVAAHPGPAEPDQPAYENTNRGHCGLIFTIKMSNYVISQIQALHMLGGISQQAEEGGEGRYEL